MNCNVVEKIDFFKMSACGNDFVIMDGRDFDYPDDVAAFVRKICARKTGVGADGLIFLESSSKASFSMKFYNSDGSRVEMCGNGARCLARYAYVNGISEKKMTIETLAGIVCAEVIESQVRLTMSMPYGFKKCRPDAYMGEDVYFINTGVPHVVCIVTSLENVDVLRHGRRIRRSPEFAPDGTNVNFVRIVAGDRIELRTYERGVEDETLACGTGAVASALVCNLLGKVRNFVEVYTKGGYTLQVEIEKEKGEVKAVYLKGAADFIYQGILSREFFEKFWRK